MDSAFNLARWLARNDEDAEDIVQEAYLRAYTFFDGFRGDNGRPWLLQIVRNTFYTLHQQRKTEGESIAFDDALHGLGTDDLGGAPRAAHEPEAHLCRKDDRRELDRALMALPAEFREVLVLRELEDLSYKEISGIAGIPIGTVMSRLARARKQLAHVLNLTKPGA